MLPRSPSHPGRSCWTVLLLITLALVTTAPASLRFAQAQSAEYTVQWGNQASLVGAGGRSYFPSVAVDGNGVVHVAFVDASGAIKYVNNASGSISAPQTIEQGEGTNREPYFAIAAAGNTVHIAYSWYGVDNHIYYRQGTVSGASVTWSARQRISDNDRSFAADLAIDRSGNAHIVWIDRRCGDQPQVGYRVRYANGSLSAISTPRNRCSEFQNRPRVAVTNDGKPHLAFQAGGEIYYARLDAAGWVNQNISNSSTNSNNPTIATDGTGVYVAWGEGIDDRGNQDVRFRRSIDGGQNWSSMIALSDTPDFAQFPSATYSAGAQRVYIAWQDDTGQADGQHEIWYREFNPADGTTTAARRLSNLPKSSALPSISAGPGRVGLAWQDRVNDLEVYYMIGTTPGGGGPVPTPPPTGCTGTLVLEGGAASTRKNPVSGVISPSGCQPAQMQVSVDTPPDAKAPKVAYTSNISVQIPPGEGCARKVYVRLFDASGASGALIEATIAVDTSVTATVLALNPHLSNLPTTYTPPQTTSARPADVLAAGARDGAPTYTRDRAFFLSVSDGGDCSGLKGFAVEGSIAGQVPPTGFASALPLPGDGSAGVKNFNVVVTDTVDNKGMFPSAAAKFSIVYDPPDTDPSTTVTNTAGLPVLADGGSVTVSSENSIFRTLAFKNINVNDNLYGQQGENLSQGRQFWGVWIANSRQDNDQDNPNLEWIPVRVSAPGSSFSVPWNLFEGLDYGADPTRTGDYYVYVRFLDGAGNPSAGFLKARATLRQGYTVARVNLPLVLG